MTKKMFNVFLTFSVADLHEPALHQKIAESHRYNYMDKIVVKDLNSVPPEKDISLYIDEKSDYQQRLTAINENTDIVNAYVIEKADKLWKNVLQPVLGGELYIRRYEFQHRGSIHCHMLMSVEHGPSCSDMKLAKKDLPNLDDCQTEEQVAVATAITENIKAARK